MTLKEKKINSVRNWLRDHVVPQAKFDGMTTYAMAVSLVELMENVEIDEQVRFNELNVINQYEGM